MVHGLGRGAIAHVEELGKIAVFGVASLWHYSLQRNRFAKLRSAVHEIGVRCVPIILIVGIFTGLVFGLQLYYTLRDFGSEGALGTAVSLSMVRELGPVLGALMIVGQAGSALASELGIQRNGEQIDALQTMGVNPQGYLVGPRLVAALICFPVLVAFFDLIGIFGGFVSGSLLLSVDPGVYWSKVYSSVSWEDVRGGFLKALVFGYLTILICSYQGFNTHIKASAKGVRGVSESATRAVVISCIVVLAADYLITSFLL